MKKIMLFGPAIIALLLYLIIGLISNFRAISPFVWLFVALLFVSAVFMFKGKWFGCIGGIIVGVVLIYMSMQYTGQSINIEKPLGIILCIYFLMCGFLIYKRSVFKK